MMLREIKTHLLNIPLKQFYHLAFGDVTHFDTIVIEVRDGDGRNGFGEATLLPAYGGGTVDGAWAFVREKAESLAGLAPEAAMADLGKSLGSQSFAVSAFVAAIEMLEGHDVLALEDNIRVPLLGAVNTTDTTAIPDEIEKLLAQGYTTLKVKVGFDLDSDLKRLDVIQDCVGERARLRIDGNQGYTVIDAKRFATEAEPDGIELFEQPCAAGDWDAAEAVAEVSGLPMMLDESIFGVADIERAAKLGIARFIKLKLFKMGGVENLLQGLERIRALGMEPVLGNGVAADISCWMEACVAAKVIDNAGEFNGFLRPESCLFEDPLKVEGGALVLAAGFQPRLDQDKIAAFAVGNG